MVNVVHTEIVYDVSANHGYTYEDSVSYHIHTKSDTEFGNGSMMILQNFSMLDGISDLDVGTHSKLFMLT